jgi:hypothetical protein
MFEDKNEDSWNGQRMDNKDGSHRDDTFHNGACLRFDCINRNEKGCADCVHFSNYHVYKLDSNGRPVGKKRGL